MTRFLKQLFCFHKYVKNSTVYDGPVVMEQFVCNKCEKEKLYAYNPSATHYCPICEKREHDCHCLEC